MDRSAVSHVIVRVSRALARMLDEYVRLPATQKEADKTMDTFYAIMANFPTFILGCIESEERGRL